MIVKTKSYRLDKKSYIKLAFTAILRQQWWMALGGVLLISAGFFWIQSIWWFIVAILALGLYLLFWYIQFYGVTQLEQGKLLFEKFTYEINSQQIVMKINAREGMPIKWDQVARAKVGKDHVVLFINKAQLIHLPFKIFNTENERKFLLTILRNKGLIA